MRKCEDEEERWVRVVDTKKKPDIGVKLAFQVADVKKPRIAVKRNGEQGNKVQFGPVIPDNYIDNQATGHRMLLKPNGRGS